jgi:hypothetical protein
VKHCCMLTIETMRRDFEHTLGQFKATEIFVSLNCALVKLYNCSVIISGSLSHVLIDSKESKFRKLFRTLTLVSPSLGWKPMYKFKVKERQVPVCGLHDDV